MSRKLQQLKRQKAQEEQELQELQELLEHQIKLQSPPSKKRLQRTSPERDTAPAPTTKRSKIRVRIKQPALANEPITQVEQVRQVGRQQLQHRQQKESRVKKEARARKRAKKKYQQQQRLKRKEQERIKCLKGWQLKQILGQGTYGTVHQACDMVNDCTYAVKIVPLKQFATMAASRNDFLIESAITDSMWTRFGIGPKYYSSWICNNEGYIVTELWDGVLPMGACISPPLVEKLRRQIETMHAAGLVHGDILEKNVLVKRGSNATTNEIIDVTLTDFGFTRSFEDWLNEPKWLKTVAEYIVHPVQSTWKYYYENGLTIEDVLRNPYELDYALIYSLKKGASC